MSSLGGGGSAAGAACLRLGGDGGGSVWAPTGATLLSPHGRTVCMGRSTEPERSSGTLGAARGRRDPGWGDVSGEGPRRRAGGSGGPQALPCRAGGCFREQKGKSLGRREARFINQGLRMARVAFTAPPAPGNDAELGSAPGAFRHLLSPTCCRYSSETSIPRLGNATLCCALTFCLAEGVVPSTLSLLTHTSTSGGADGEGSCRWLYTWLL